MFINNQKIAGLFQLENIYTVMEDIEKPEKWPKTRSPLVGTKKYFGKISKTLQNRNIRIVYDQPTSIYTMTYIIETNASVNLGCDIMGRPLMFDKRMEKRIMFRVPDEVYEIYEQEAKLREMTINQFIREIILNP